MTNFEKMHREAPLDFTEIHKLDKLLTEAGVPHTLLPMPPFFGEGLQICAYYDDAMTHKIDDCVIHRFSHGAWEGLLETFTLHGCGGYGTAKEVFEGWMALHQGLKAEENAQLWPCRKNQKTAWQIKNNVL